MPVPRIRSFRPLKKALRATAKPVVTAFWAICCIIVSLWNPIRYHIHNHIGLSRVICHVMYRKIVRATHALVHHRNARLDRCAFTRLKDHRTDGQLGRSAPLLIHPDGSLPLHLDGSQGRRPTAGTEKQDRSSDQQQAANYQHPECGEASLASVFS